MRALLLAALVAAQEVYRFDFSLDDQPLSGEFTSDQDLWQLAADFVAGRGWRLEDESRACRDASTELERDNCAVALVVELWGQALPPATEGCPTAGYGSRVRLFVAVPSAAHYTSRRQAIRTTWCRRAQQALTTSGGQDSATVAFFVGSSEHDDAIRAENATHKDLVMVPVQDAATNVTAKLLYSLHYFSQRDFTHYIRVEDDVYLFADRLMANLRAVDASRHNGRWALARYATNESLLPGMSYPRGFAVVLPHRVAHGLALLDETMGLGVASRATGQYGIAATGAKGGWVRNRFWCDDQHLGLLLHPTQTHLEDEPRFHDLPGRGPHAQRVSHASMAVNAVQTDAEFRALHVGKALGGEGAPTYIAEEAWTREGEEIVVRADLDGTANVMRIADPARAGAAACDASARRAADAARDAYPHVQQLDTALRAALLAVCDAASNGETDWTLGYRPAYRGTEPPTAFVALPVVAFRSG